MGLRIDSRADQRLAQTLSPRLQQAVKLLQMSSLDFAAMVRDSSGQNPFLESEEGDDGPPEAEYDGGPGLGGESVAGETGTPLAGCSDSDDWANAGSGSEGSSSEPDDSDADNDRIGNHDSDPDGDPDSQRDGERDGEHDRDLWLADGGSGLRPPDDGPASAMDSAAAETSLTMHLHHQLSLSNLPPRDLLAARTVVESLDDDGYLRTPLAELLAVAPMRPAASLQELRIALRRVQSLDPAGVGARSVGECLLLQLPAIDDAELRRLAQTIVGQHLPALAARDVGGLARALGEVPARIEAACDRIRRLDPRPGWRFGSTPVAYVVPDIIVRKVRGQWSVQLNPAVVPRVRFNQVYADLFQRHRTAHHGEMASHLQEARWTLRNVEQRFSTIVDVGAAIVRRQRHFLEFGAMAMKPLGLREIADEVGIHESTVSRVTNNKFMATPIGVFELKYFFSRALLSRNGSACSGTAIRGLIGDLIGAEAPDAPLSDAEITRQLGGQGLVVARRTVTKYRQMLRIEAVERRRRHG